MITATVVGAMRRLELYAIDGKPYASQQSDTMLVLVALSLLRAKESA